MLRGEEAAAGEMSLHEAEQVRGDRARLGEVARPAPERDQARHSRTVLHLPGGDREPALHPRGPDRIVGEPARVPAVLPRQVHEDGAAVRHDQLAVLQDRDLAERIQGAELRRAAHGGRRVDEVVREAEHAQEQLDAVGMAGEHRSVE